MLVILGQSQTQELQVSVLDINGLLLTECINTLGNAFNPLNEISIVFDPFDANHMVQDSIANTLTIFTDDATQIMTAPVATIVTITLNGYTSVLAIQKIFSLQILDPCPETTLSFESLISPMTYTLGDPAKTQTFDAKDLAS